MCDEQKELLRQKNELDAKLAKFSTSPSALITKRQQDYLIHLFAKHRDRIMLNLFCASTAGRDLQYDLSDITKEEASFIIGKLVKIATEGSAAVSPYSPYMRQKRGNTSPVPDYDDFHLDLYGNEGQEFSW